MSPVSEGIFTSLHETIYWKYRLKTDVTVKKGVCHIEEVANTTRNTKKKDFIFAHLGEETTPKDSGELAIFLE